MTGVASTRKRQKQFRFLVYRPAQGVANISGTMKSSLDSQCQFNSILGSWHSRGLTVQLLEYLSFRPYYETIGKKEDIPVHEFMEHIPPEIVLKL